MYYLFNTTIIPTKRDKLKISLSRIAIEQAIQILKNNNCYSAIGHEATASALSILCGKTIPYNREQVFLVPGDKVLAFKLNTRIPIGIDLNQYQLNEIGYTFFLMEIS